jgi:GAF domain-containing protein
MTRVYRRVDDPSPHLPEDFDARVYISWAPGQVFSGKAVTLPDFEKAPAEAAGDGETWRCLGIKSLLIFPLSSGGENTFGAASSHSIEAERSWPDEIVQRLRLVAQIFANAVVRKRADAALRESEERLKLATEDVPAGPRFESPPPVQPDPRFKIQDSRFSMRKGRSMLSLYLGSLVL